jgi:UDP-N-acetylglucosamine 2-epimerase
VDTAPGGLNLSLDLSLVTVVSIVGARPQFIKASALSRELRKSHREILVHTGQHYDGNMSAIFFEELGIPEPDFNLGVGSGLHGEQTGAMLARIEEVLLKEKPDWVLVYGDTNSTLAGALAAAKLHVRVAHVEAGLRSYNRAMPEELNRVVADHLSTLLFCPGDNAAANLAREGITSGVHVVGDVMADALAAAKEKAESRSAVLERLGVKEKQYCLATVHRAENTDDCGRLANILAALGSLGEPVVFPMHPRTRAAIELFGLPMPAAPVIVSEPLGYLDTVALGINARVILTDSGGMQKEAYWLGVPCVTLRDETEWVETVKAGWNTIAGADKARIAEAVRASSVPSSRPPLYGSAGAAVCCARGIEGKLDD